mgnify:CR=1 FL=1
MTCSLPWMELGKELYTTANYLYFQSNKNINMFSSAFLFQNILMVFPIFKMLCSQKQAGTNHVFYLVMPHEIEVVKSKILDEGPVPKKA